MDRKCKYSSNIPYFLVSVQNVQNGRGVFRHSFRDLTLDISKVRDYNGHIKNEGGARDEAFCHGSDESVEPYRCRCVRTGLLLCLQSIRNPQHLPGRCHSGCVHFSLPDYEPYCTGMACSACNSCTCGTHYEAIEYGRKQKCGGWFHESMCTGIGTIKIRAALLFAEPLLF